MKQIVKVKINNASLPAGLRESLLDVNDTTTGFQGREDVWSSCSYFYLNKPENKLPPLAYVERRFEGLYGLASISQLFIKAN